MCFHNTLASFTGIPWTDTLAGGLGTPLHGYFQIVSLVFPLHSCPTCCWTPRELTQRLACILCSSERASRSTPNQSRKSSKRALTPKGNTEPSSCNILSSTLPPCVNFEVCLFSFLGATRRSSTTPTSTTRTRFTAPPSPRPPPSARRWWRCKTAPGGATSLRCTWSRGKSPSATGAPPSSTRNVPRTLTAPRSTTTPRAPAAGSSPQCSWSPARTRVPASFTQRICRAAGCSSS